MAQDSLDLLCLKALRVDPDAERVALNCASIIVSAHALAQAAPGLGAEARRIVDLTRRLYAVMPSKAVIAALADDFMAEVGTGPRDARTVQAARQAFVHRVWQHFQHGAEPADA